MCELRRDPVSGFVLDGLGEVALCIGCELPRCTARTSDGYPICVECASTIPADDDDDAFGDSFGVGYPGGYVHAADCRCAGCVWS